MYVIAGFFVGKIHFVTPDGTWTTKLQHATRCEQDTVPPWFDPFLYRLVTYEEAQAILTLSSL